MGWKQRWEEDHWIDKDPTVNLNGLLICQISGPKKELDHFYLPRHMEGLVRKFERLAPCPYKLVQWPIGVQQDTQVAVLYLVPYLLPRKQGFVSRERHFPKTQAASKCIVQLFNEDTQLVGIEWKLYGYLKDGPMYIYTYIRFFKGCRCNSLVLLGARKPFGMPLKLSLDASDDRVMCKPQSVRLYLFQPKVIPLLHPC